MFKEIIQVWKCMGTQGRCGSAKVLDNYDKQYYNATSFLFANA